MYDRDFQQIFPGFISFIFFILAAKAFTWVRCTIYHALLWIIFLGYLFIPFFKIWGEMVYLQESFRCSIRILDENGNEKNFTRDYHRKIMELVNW